MRALLTCATVIFLLPATGWPQATPAKDLDAAPFLKAFRKLADPTQEPDIAPGLKGCLLLYTKSSEVCLPTGGVIELIPPPGDTKFTPEQVQLVVNNTPGDIKRIMESEPFPSFPVTVEARGLSQKRLRVVELDSFRRPLEVMRCTLRRLAGPSPAASFAVSGNRLTLTAPAGRLPAAVRVFLGDTYAGRLTGSLGDFALDARSLCPGTYTFTLIPEDADGVIYPSITSTVTLPTRLALSSPAEGTTVEIEKDTTSTTLHVSREGAPDVAKVRVYANGALVGEKADPAFDLTIPLTQVPSGEIDLEAVGVSEDGTRGYPQSLTIKVQNYVWNNEAFGSPVYADLQEKLKLIGKLDEEIKYNFTKAMTEPAFQTIVSTTGARETRTGITSDVYLRINASALNVIIQRIPTGKPAEYLAKWRVALMKRLQVKFEVAMLYKQLTMRKPARRMFQAVVQEAGLTHPLSLRAGEELEKLTALP